MVISCSVIVFDTLQFSTQNSQIPFVFLRFTEALLFGETLQKTAKPMVLRYAYWNCEPLCTCISKEHILRVFPQQAKPYGFLCNNRDWVTLMHCVNNLICHRVPAFSEGSEGSTGSGLPWVPELPRVPRHPESSQGFRAFQRSEAFQDLWNSKDNQYFVKFT